MKEKIKSLIPPILFDFIKRFRYFGWKGNYKTWEEAQKRSTKYDADEILTKVTNSLLKVKNGEAIYERDSVLFDEIHYSWPLLTGLMFSSIKTGKLKVLDFGGSLGSTYYQNKKFLDEIENLSWSIVEQKHFIKAGKENFENNRLKFYYTIEECMEKENPNVLLLSGVLQYIEKPYKLLDEILKYKFDYILIDRMPFSLNNKDKIKLQIVPTNIYKASYPCWFFDEQNFKKYINSKGFNIVEEFEALDGSSNEYIFKGMIWSANV